MWIKQLTRWWVVLALLAGMASAMAAPEPTMEQVYQAAQAGKLDEAQKMMQLVLVAHPNSGKAHYVQAELWARQEQTARAREELALAEQHSPGLPFAKPEAVSALRTQLAGNAGNARPPATAVTPHMSAPARQPESPFPWGMVLLAGGGVLLIVLYLTRRNAPQTYPEQAPMAAANPLGGPQNFGYGNNAPGYGPGMPPQAGPGLGSRVAGGLATGLAVGAGVLAAEAIGRRLMSDDRGDAHAASNHAGNNDAQPFVNNDMGGQNFGVNDASSWDDGGGASSGSDGGGDWDN